MFSRGFFSFLICVTLVSGKEYVPVLLWSTQTTGDSFTDTSALTKFSTDEFSSYLHKRIKGENPLILAFMEENLSVEDFSWRDLNQNSAFPLVNNITKVANDVSFLPSVHEPYKALKKLTSQGYNWKNYHKNSFEELNEYKNVILEIVLEEPDYLEDRPEMLKEHDEQIAKIYSEALKYESNLMVIYTGNHSSWIDVGLTRYKREDKTEGSGSISISDSNGVIRMTVTSPIVFTSNESATNITKHVGDPTVNEVSDRINMTVKFPLNTNPVSFKFLFKSSANKWWTLDSIEVELQGLKLKPEEPIGGPSGYSYFCNPSVKFLSKTHSLIFENLQVQPRVGKNNSFGPVIHCIPYFSIAIWSGIVIVAILSLVLAWGIMMIMDINTNDRFDDPKGKTITITATD